MEAGQPSGQARIGTEEPQSVEEPASSQRPRHSTRASANPGTKYSNNDHNSFAASVKRKQDTGYGAEEQCCKLLLERFRPSDWLLQDDEHDASRHALPLTKEEMEQLQVSQEKVERQRKLDEFLAKVKEMKKKEPAKYAKKKSGRSPPSDTAPRIARKCEDLKHLETKRDQKLQEFLADVKKPKQSEPPWVKDILLQRHLQQYHEIMKVQPPRHTQHQREMAMVYEREAQDERDHEQLMELRAKKQMEFLLDMYNMEKSKECVSKCGNSKEHAIDDLYPLHDSVNDHHLVSIGDRGESPHLAPTDDDPFMTTSSVTTSLYSAISSSLHSSASESSPHKMALDAEKPFTNDTDQVAGRGSAISVNKHQVDCVDLPPEELESDVDYSPESEGEMWYECDDNGSPASPAESCATPVSPAESCEGTGEDIETVHTAADADESQHADDVCDVTSDDVTTPVTTPPACDSSTGRCSTCHHCLTLPLFSASPSKLSVSLPYNSTFPMGVSLPHLPSSQVPTLPLWLLMNDQLLLSESIQLKYTPTSLIWEDHNVHSRSTHGSDDRQGCSDSQQAGSSSNHGDHCDEEKHVSSETSAALNSASDEGSRDSLVSDMSTKAELHNRTSTAAPSIEYHHDSSEWQETSVPSQGGTHIFGRSQAVSSEEFQNEQSHSVPSDNSTMHFSRKDLAISCDTSVAASVIRNDVVPGEMWDDHSDFSQCHLQSQTKTLMRSVSVPSDPSTYLNTSESEPVIRRRKYGPQRRKRIIDPVLDGNTSGVGSDVKTSINESVSTVPSKDVNVNDNDGSESHQYVPNSSDIYVPLTVHRSVSTPCQTTIPANSEDDWCETPVTSVVQQENHLESSSESSFIKPTGRPPGFALKMPTKSPFPLPQKSSPVPHKPPSVDSKLSINSSSQFHQDLSVRPVAEDWSQLLTTGCWDDEEGGANSVGGGAKAVGGAKGEEGGANVVPSQTKGAQAPLVCDDAALAQPSRSTASAPNSHPRATRLQAPQRYGQLHVTQGFHQPHDDKSEKFNLEKSPSKLDGVHHKKRTKPKHQAAGRGKRTTENCPARPSPRAGRRSYDSHRGVKSAEFNSKMSVLDQVLAQQHCYMDKEEMWDEEEQTTSVQNSGVQNSVHTQERSDSFENLNQTTSEKHSKKRYGPKTGSYRKKVEENLENIHVSKDKTSKTPPNMRRNTLSEDKASKTPPNMRRNTLSEDKASKTPPNMRRNPRKVRVPSSKEKLISSEENDRTIFRGGKSESHLVPYSQNVTDTTQHNRISNVTRSGGRDSPAAEDSILSLVSGEWESDKENSTSVSERNIDRRYDRRTSHEQRRPQNNLSWNPPVNTFTAPRFERQRHQRAQWQHQHRSDSVNSRYVGPEEDWNDG